MSKRTILLLQPTIGYMDSWRSAPSLPLALLHASTFAAQRYHVRLFDQRLNPQWKIALRHEIETTQPILIGATMFLGQAVANSLRMLEEAKRICKAPTVIGGVLPSLMPEDCLADTRVDYVVQGEGEKAILELARCLENHEVPSSVSGIWFRNENRISGTKHTELLHLDLLPEIPYHLIPVEKYLPRYGGISSFYMETSRGCPLSCTYCFNPEFNHGVWRAQSAQHVRERLAFAKNKFNMKDVYFVDDNFFIDIKRGLEIAKAMGQFGLRWQVQGVGISSLKKMSDEELRFLSENGLRRMTVGLESGSPKIKKILGKHYTNEEVKDVISRLKEFKIIVYCSFMCNLPGETHDDVKQSIILMFDLMKLNPNFRSSPFYNYAPSPGTALFHAAVQEGFKPPKSLEQWARISFDGNETEISGSNNARFYKGLYIATLFSDRKPHEYSTSFFFRILAFLYKPIARFRLKKMFFYLMPEINLFYWMIKPRN